MKTTLRILTALLLCMILCCCLTAAASAEYIVMYGSSGNLSYTLDDEGTLIIYGEGEMLNYNGFAPWYSFNYQVKVARIEEGVTSIGSYAFGSCSALTDVILPSSVTSIGNNAFAGCNNLAVVYYMGSESQWNSITIEDGNQPF